MPVGQRDVSQMPVGQMVFDLMTRIVSMSAEASGFFPSSSAVLLALTKTTTNFLRKFLKNVSLPVAPHCESDLSWFFLLNAPLSYKNGRKIIVRNFANINPSRC